MKIILVMVNPSTAKSLPGKYKRPRLVIQGGPEVFFRAHQEKPAYYNGPEDIRNSERQNETRKKPPRCHHGKTKITNGRN